MRSIGSRGKEPFSGSSLKSEPGGRNFVFGLGKRLTLGGNDHTFAHRPGHGFENPQRLTTPFPTLCPPGSERDSRWRLCHGRVGGYSSPCSRLRTHPYAA